MADVQYKLGAEIQPLLLLPCLHENVEQTEYDNDEKYTIFGKCKDCQQEVVWYTNAYHKDDIPHGAEEWELKPQK